MTQAGPGPTAARPRVLVAALAILGLHTVGLVAAGVFLLVRTALGGAHNARDATVEGVFTLAGAGVFAALLLGLSRRPPVRAARTPAVLLELIVVPVAIGLVQSGRPELGLPLLASALVAVGGLLAGVPAAR